MNKYVLVAFLMNLASTQLYALRENNGNQQNPNNIVVQNNANPPVQHMNQPYIVNVQPMPRPRQPNGLVVTLSTGHTVYMPDGLGNNQNQNQRP